MKKFKRKPHFIQYLLAGLAVTATAGTVFAADRFVMDKQQVPTGETEIAAMVSQLPTGETEEDDTAKPHPCSFAASCPGNPSCSFSGSARHL